MAEHCVDRLALVVLRNISSSRGRDRDVASFFWVQRGAIQLANGLGCRLASR